MRDLYKNYAYRMETKKDIPETSLDVSDVNPPPTSQKHSDSAAVAMCSTSKLNSGKNECKESVIRTVDTKQGLNEPVIKKITCHICNIKVPEVYFTKHETSSLHICNWEIVENALKRLELFSKQKYINKSNEKLSSKYFCAECSIVINRKDKRSHKQTKRHRNSVSLVVILNKFLRYYTIKTKKPADNKAHDIKIKHVEESKNSEQENFLEKNSTVEMPTFISTINSDEQKRITEINVNEEITESTKENAKETNSDENSEALSNLGELKSDDNLSIDLKEDEMLLELNVGSSINKFKVLKCCVDGIVETGVTSDCCMVCEESFSRKKRSTHVKSDLHKINYFLKPLDKNCIRKINGSRHNCVLCNDYFEEYELHVNSEIHLTNFRNKLMCERTKEAEDSNNRKEEKEYDNSKEHGDVSEVDDKSLTDGNKNTAPVNKETIDSLALRTSFRWLYAYMFPDLNLSSNILCDTCNKWVSLKKVEKHNMGTKHVFNAISEYHYLLENLDEVNLVCKICQVTISNVPEDIEKHCTGSKHLKTYSKFLRSQSISKLDNKLYYCAKCKQYILNKTEYLHIKSKKHIRPMEEIDKIGLIKTGITNKGSDGTGRSNVKTDTGDAKDIGGAGPSKSTDNVKAKKDYCPVSDLIKVLSKLPNILAYKKVDRLRFRNTRLSEVDKSEEGNEEVRILKILLKHSISLRRQKYAA